jgi:hypothetical protein
MGRRATLPRAGYRRPDMLSADGLVVAVVGEDGRDNGTYDFTNAAGAGQLKLELVAVFARLASSAGTWTTAGTCRVNARALRRFLRFAADHLPPVTCTGEITATAWNEWRLSVGHGPHGAVGLVRRLLREVSLPAGTRAAVDARSRKPPQGQVASYTFEEFRLIRDAARRTVSAVEARIGEGVTLVDDWQGGRLDPDSEAGRWGHLLHRISLSGEFPFVVHALGPDAVHQATGGLVRTSTDALRRLYPSYLEMAAAAVLLICHEAWNTSTLAEMDVPDQHPNADPGEDAPAVQRVSTVKRRRPRRDRHASNNLVDVGAGSAGRAMRQVLAITVQARTTLAALGTPTARLLVARRYAQCEGLARFTHGDAVVLEEAIARWSKQAGLVTAAGVGVRVSPRRLRRTVQVLYGGPRNNSRSTHENVYLLRDGQVRAESGDVVAKGLSDAVDHAVARLRMRLVRHGDGSEHADPGVLAAQAGIPLATARRVAAGRLDTAAAACIDFEHSPFTPSGPCTVSFLLCFACPNALATDRHLPRIVYLHDAMTGLRSAVDPAVWLVDWAGHYSRVTDLLHSHTSTAERPALRGRVSDTDRALVDAMLARRLDG